MVIMVFWRTKVESRVSHTSNKWFCYQLELRRTTWKGSGEEDAVVERDFQAMEPYKVRD
jgi:hypothetical protein